MKCHTRTKISFGLKTGMNSFRNDLYGKESSSRYHVNRYREIYGDGMNSGMKVILVSCEQALLKSLLVDTPRWRRKRLLAFDTGVPNTQDPQTQSRVKRCE